MIVFCGGCGEMKERSYDRYKGWTNVAARWVEDEKWWNPLTWHEGRWEAKQDK